MQVIPKLLLIAGTGRNTGKTTLVCSVIKRFSPQYPVIGLKISPHFHGGSDTLKPIFTNKDFNIYEETTTNSTKDSSLMLKSGASMVFYIEVLDEHLKQAFDQFLNVIPATFPIICESPALISYVKPAVFFIVDNEKIKNKKKEVFQKREIANKWIDTANEDILKVIDQLSIEQNEWKFNS